MTILDPTISQHRAPTVLVVDDEEGVRMTLEDFLSALGYLVLTANDGREGLDMLSAAEVDIVITDIHMPVMTGLEMLRHASEAYPYLPIILITGQPSVDAAVQCLRHGAADFITKPFDLSRIETALQTALEKRRNVELAAAPAVRDELRLPPGYTYVRTLGEGSMGIVYLVAELRPPQRFLALKILRTDDLSYDERRERVFRFGHEIRAAGMVDHPNIVKVYECGPGGDGYGSFVAMEYVPGQPLTFFVRHDDLTLPHKLVILRQVADALRAIHEVGVCHRDIKPANVLVNEELVPKLTDFGVARVPNSDLTQTRQLLGSPSYMAPEAFLEAGSDPRSDIFSLGVVAWELLHGKRLFTGDSLMAIMHRICAEDSLQKVKFDRRLPEEVHHVIRTCLARNPDDRWQDCAQLVAALDSLLEICA